MDRFATWLWAKYRTRFVLSTAVVMYLVTQVTFTIPSCFGIGFFVGADVMTMLRFTLFALVVEALSVAIVAVWNERATKALSAWARGESDEVVAAWDDAVRLPALVYRRIAVPLLTSNHLIVLPVAARWVPLTRGEHIALQFGLLTIEASVLVIISLMTRNLYFPPTRELSALVPLEAKATQREPSLRVLLTMGVLLTCINTGFATSMVVRGSTSVAAAMATSWAVATLIAGYMAALVYLGLVKPSFEPIGDLIAATRRVHDGVYSERISVTTGNELGDIAREFNQMQRGLLERESLHQAFGSYVDPALAQRLLEEGDSVFEGEDVDVTVFFADVRGFTTYASHAPATEAVARLNRLFELVVPIIRDHGGHANTYLGDGVLAVFGTPQPLDNHADEAVAAALDIQRAVTREFGESLRVGIGVNTGGVIAGTIGGGGKLEFTVIGDTVNVASRVEALTKETGDPILLTQATADALIASPASLVDRGLIEVRGKDEKLHVHGLRP